MRTHYLALILPHLDLRGSRTLQWENRVISLGYATLQLRQRGDRAKGYLMLPDLYFMREGRPTRDLVERYEMEDLTILTTPRGIMLDEVIPVWPTPEEAAQDAKAMRNASWHLPALREELATLIEEEHGPMQRPPQEDAPLQMDWDFYGVKEG